METSVKDICQQLRAPLPSKQISWRVGRKANNETLGQALPYVTPRDIQNVLDDIVGPANWRNSFQASNLGAGFPSVIATLELKLDGVWIAKSDGAQVDSFKEDGENNSKEMAIKGAYSDAFKRAAVMWGIGRYLYEFEAPWVLLTDKQLAEIPLLPVHMVPEAERADFEAAWAAKVEVEEATTKAETPSAASKPAEKPAAKVAEKPAPVEASKAVTAEPVKADEPVAAKEEPKAETKADEPVAVKEEPKAETKADEPVAAKEEPKAEAKTDEAAALERAASLVDQELGNTVADVKPVAAPAKAAADAAPSAPGMPDDLTAEQSKTFKGLLEKIEKKLPTQMLRNYVNGPKAATALPEAARTYLLTLLDQAEAAKDAAAA
jgi:hypothetical protein